VFKEQPGRRGTPSNLVDVIAEEWYPADVDEEVLSKRLRSKSLTRKMVGFVERSKKVPDELRYANVEPYWHEGWGGWDWGRGKVSSVWHEDVRRWTG